MSNNSSEEVMAAFIEGFLLGQRPGSPNVNATMALYLFRRRHSCSTAAFRAAYARINEQRTAILRMAV